MAGHLLYGQDVGPWFASLDRGQLQDDAPFPGGFQLRGGYQAHVPDGDQASSHHHNGWVGIPTSDNRWLSLGQQVGLQPVVVAPTQLGQPFTASYSQVALGSQMAAGQAAQNPTGMPLSTTAGIANNGQVNGYSQQYGRWYVQI